METHHKVELIVLDMIMDPGMDGLETYRRILEIAPGQKAVIVSGYSETDRVKEAQRLGVYVRSLMCWKRSVWPFGMNSTDNLRYSINYSAKRL